MRKVLIFAVILLLFSCKRKSTESVATLQTPHSAVVVAYVHNEFPDWGEGYERLVPITHINFAFANVRNGLVSEEYEKSSEKIKSLVELKKIKHDLNILVSLGGWSWSKGFSEAASTSQSREILANSCISLVKKYGLDGIDIDWEYPGQPGDNNPFNSADKENFTFLLERIRTKFDSLEIQEHRELLLTIAVGTNKQWIENTEMDKVAKIVDLVNLMTYDFSGSGYSEFTAHHANLYDSKYDSSSTSADNSVNLFIQAGVPPSKITLGVPFYGKAFNKVENGPLHSPFENGESRGYKWTELEVILNEESSLKYYWDSTAQAPYLWDSIKHEFVTFDDTRSLALKTQYVSQMGLAGIMFLKYDQDSGLLLSTINDNLPKKQP